MFVTVPVCDLLGTLLKISVKLPNSKKVKLYNSIRNIYSVKKLSRLQKGHKVSVIQLICSICVFSYYDGFVECFILSLITHILIIQELILLFYYTRWRVMPIFKSKACCKIEYLQNYGISFYNKIILN